MTLVTILVIQETNNIQYTKRRQVNYKTHKVAVIFTVSYKILSPYTKFGPSKDAITKYLTSELKRGAVAVRNLFVSCSHNSSERERGWFTDEQDFVSLICWNFIVTCYSKLLPNSSFIYRHILINWCNVLFHIVFTAMVEYLSHLSWATVLRWEHL